MPYLWGLGSDFCLRRMRLVKCLGQVFQGSGSLEGPSYGTFHQTSPDSCGFLKW